VVCGSNPYPNPAPWYGALWTWLRGDALWVFAVDVASSTMYAGCGIGLWPCFVNDRSPDETESGVPVRDCWSQLPSVFSGLACLASPKCAWLARCSGIDPDCRVSVAAGPEPDRVCAIPPLDAVLVGQGILDSSGPTLEQEPLSVLLARLGGCSKGGFAFVGALPPESAR